MEYNNHNPSISIAFGSISGVITFMSEHGILIDNFMQLLKVIIFAIIGGIFGYVGRLIASKIHKLFKK